MSGGVSLLGMYIGVKQIKGGASDFLNAILGIFEPHSLILALSLLIPLTVFFAAALLSISIFARSFKEAQSMMAPLNILIILPVVVGMLPGIPLDTLTALIPVLNVSLAAKEIFARTITPGLLLEVYGTLIFLAGVSIAFCARWFDRETTIFRET